MPGNGADIRVIVIDGQPWFPARGVQCVNESGLFKMLFWSRKPAALDFQNWVIEVVLPVIENDVGYVMGEEKVETEEDALAMHICAMRNTHPSRSTNRST